MISKNYFILKKYWKLCSFETPKYSFLYITNKMYFIVIVTPEKYRLE